MWLTFFFEIFEGWAKDKGGLILNQILNRIWNPILTNIDPNIDMNIEPSIDPIIELNTKTTFDWK